MFDKLKCFFKGHDYQEIQHDNSFEHLCHRCGKRILYIRMGKIDSLNVKKGDIWVEYGESPMYYVKRIK